MYTILKTFYVNICQLLVVLSNYFLVLYVFYTIIINYYCALKIETLSGIAEEYQLLFQTAGSLNMEDLISLHHYIMMYLFIIFIFVFLMTYFSYSDFKISNFYNLSNKYEVLFNINETKRSIAYETIKIKHHSLLEFIWTLIPSIILLFISVPSFLLLYSVEENINPTYIVKVIAHQWYWVYEIIKG